MFSYFWYLLGYDTEEPKQQVVINNNLGVSKDELKEAIQEQIKQLKSVDDKEKIQKNYKPELKSIKQQEQKKTYSESVKKEDKK